MRTRFAAGMLGLALLGAEPAEITIHSGPWAPPATSITVQTNLVEVGAVVRDSRGDPAGGFQADDFILRDDGRPQKISVFVEQRTGSSKTGSGAATEPRTTALFFDDIYSGPFAFSKARAAARDLAAKSLRPGDRMGLFTNSGEGELDFTSNTAALLAAIDALHPRPLPGPKELGACPSYNPYISFTISNRLDEEVRQRIIRIAIACNCPIDDGGACIAEQPALVDNMASETWRQFKAQSAVSLDSLADTVTHLASAPGSRVLLMMSPGFISGDLDRSISAIIDAALRARIVINAVDPAGLDTGAAARRTQQITSELMATASAATGGRFIENNNDVSGAARGLTAPPDVSYVLGFAAGKPDDKMHALKVSLRKPGYHVDSRAAYFSVAMPPVETAQGRIDRAATSNDPFAEIPVTTKVTASAGTVQIDTRVDARALHFGGDEQQRVQQLTFVTVLRNAAGEYLQGKIAVMDLRLSPAKWTGLEAEGIKTATRFNVPRGAYRVRQVVREAVSNHLAATDTAIDVK
jgi:VWFA-related protein